MSSISSVSSSFSTSATSGSSRSNKRNGPKQFENDLQSFLTTQGVSASDQKSILTEIQDALKSQLSSGSRPDPAKLKDTVSGVLSNHGIDASGFISQLPDPLAGGPGGPGGLRGLRGLRGLGGPGGPRGNKKPGDADANQSFLDFLTKELDKELKKRNAASSSNATDATNASTATNPTNATPAAASSTTSNQFNFGSGSNSPYSSLSQLLGSLSTFNAVA